MEKLALLGLSALIATSVATPALANDERGGGGHERTTAAEAANLGLRVGLGPTLLVPNDGGPLGGGLSLDGRYGIGAGPLIIAPGGRLTGYGISGRFVGVAMPTARVTLPIGPLAPFGVGGVGGGWLTNPGEQGLAWMAGGGLMIHFGRVLALGGEVTYQRVEGTELKTLALGPAIQLF